MSVSRVIVSGEEEKFQYLKKKIDLTLRIWNKIGLKMRIRNKNRFKNANLE